ncbi:hypothetical protein [Neorhizobium tomejilense]|uniref:hypothetical protein n=1 Tax=Neorhizobium tomejilense TaxID=2093828 RepID=UPI003ED01E3D
MNVETKLLAAKAFKKLLSQYKVIGPDYIQLAAEAIGRSRQTIKQYSARAGTKSHRTPTAEAIEAMREGVMAREVHRRTASFSGPFVVQNGAYEVNFLTCPVALDFADAKGWMMAVSSDVPPLDEAARLRHQWRRVFFGGIVTRDVLADIAQVDVYTVGWVGREHPTLGIQPTADQVARAMAAEALTELGRVA